MLRPQLWEDRALRYALLAAAAASFLVSGCSGRGQGEFPLQYVDAKENDPLVSRVTVYWYGQACDPASFKLTLVTRSGPNAALMPKELGPVSLPKGLSAKAFYFVLEQGGCKTFVVVDAASPPKLYIDTAGTFDLSAVQPLVGSGSLDAGDLVFGPASVPVLGPEGKTRSVKVRFCGSKEGPLLQLGGSVAGYMAGEVKLDGQTYRVAVVDRGLRGRYDAAADSSNQDSDSESKPAYFAIDVDGDGRFSQRYGPGESMLLRRGVCVKDKYYRVHVKPDGSSITFEPIEPRFGTLDIGLANAALMLNYDYGVLKLSGNAEGQWKVPAGAYQVYGIQVSRTDAAGTEWKIHDAGQRGRLEHFEIRGGETFAVRAGPPLEGKVDVKFSDASRSDGKGVGREASIGFTLIGQAGERYAGGAMKGDSRSPPPKFRILNEAGKVLAASQFEYGKYG